MLPNYIEFVEKPQFDHQNHREIYEHVERNGATRPEQVRRALNLDARAFGHHVAILRRDSILEKVDGRLRLAFDAGVEEVYEGGEITVTIRQTREEDLTGLVGAIRSSLGGGEYVRAESVADIVDREGVLSWHNQIRSRMFFVATVGEDVVGWVHLKHRELKKLDHTVEFTLGVLEQYQQEGIGSRLLERGVEWAGSQGFEKRYNSVLLERAGHWLSRVPWIPRRGRPRGPLQTRRDPPRRGDNGERALTSPHPRMLRLLPRYCEPPRPSSVLNC